nr:paired amphipathic helix protein sin3-like 2 [Quercus suber]
MNDAKTYLKEVEEMFQDQKDKYEEFLKLMDDFEAQRTDTVGIISKVKELFEGHANLIFGLTPFCERDLLDEFRRFLLEAAYLSAEDFGL